MNKFLPVFGLIIFFFAQTFAQDSQFSSVNSEYDEQLPVLSPDRSTLYFTRAHHPGNVGGQRDPGDIWSSTLGEDGRWSEPVNEKNLNTTGFNGILGFTIDSRGIYLLNHYGKDNNEAPTQGISRAVWQGGGWKKPENLTIPYYRNRSSHYSGYISPDGQYLLLSLESYRSVGGEDIYVCFNEGNGQWSEPLNLGRKINTGAQEFTPFLSQDYKTLYFSSNGHGGRGSSDIFMSQRLDDSWKSWSDPVPVPHVNSPGRELGYRLYDGFSIYVSTLNSDGFSDIRLYSEDPEMPIEPVAATELPAEELNTQASASELIFGTVKDSNTRMPVTAVSVKVYVNGEAAEITQNAASGYFEAILDSPGEYRFEIDAQGYISTTETLLIDEQPEYPAIEKNFLLQPIEVGATVQLPNVLFKRSSPDILPESFPELNRVAEFMKTNPNVQIRLEGHTDNTGIPKHNLRLSKARVESVKQYLVDQGVSTKRITGKGYGGTQPIADNSSEDTRRLNRRVEFTITKN